MQTRKTDGFVLFNYHRSIAPFQQSHLAKGSLYYCCQRFANVILFLPKVFDSESRMVMCNGPMKNQLQFIVTTQSHWWTIFEPSWVDSLLCPVKMAMITSPHDHNQSYIVHVYPCTSHQDEEQSCLANNWHLDCFYIGVDGTGEKNAAMRSLHHKRVPLY